MDLYARRAQRDSQLGDDPDALERHRAALIRQGVTPQEALVEAIRSDPFVLCRLLNFHPTDQQAKVLRDVALGRKKVAVKAGRGVGKTKLGGAIAFWRILRRPNALVILTAPSMKQCSDVFIAEMKRTLVDADPVLKGLFTFTTRKVFVGRRGRDEGNEPHWGLMAVTASDPVNAQGYHCESLTFIEDEASGTPRDFVGAIEGTLTQATGDVLHLQQGNPNYRDCAFFDSFHKKRKFFSCHTLSCIDSPLVAKEWVDYMREAYGEESPVYRVHVKGEFPSMDPNAIMSIDDLEACTKTDPMVMVMRSLAKQFGIDLARFGGDESTCYRRSGHAILDWKAFTMQEPDVVVDYAFRTQLEVEWRDDSCLYVSDADGLGQGVMNKFKKAGKRLLEFHTQGRPYDSRMFANRMSEAWFNLGRLVKEHDCYLPDDPILLQQLSTRLYDLDPKGRLRVERKEDYKKRMKSESLESTDSPDRADGIVMAFYEGSRPGKLALR